MKVLVFGGTGAMGIPIVKILAENGNEIIVTSRKKMTDNGKIHYITGNAHDIRFVRDILNKKYDALIDFMVYSVDEFRERIDFLISSVGQYIFMSSARVYADSKSRLTEDSPRLLDISKDEMYLQTNEYALSKAREENIIRELKRKNWTIIRPYITYNYNRLQLGVLEKEYWLQRALSGKTVVFSNEILKKQTTMTFGNDVSRHITELIGNRKAYGEIFHITNDHEIRWSDIWKLYERVIERETRQQVKIKLIENDDGVNWYFGSYYQIRYDRYYDRRFDSTKVNSATDDWDYKDTMKGLDQCLTDFIRGGGGEFFYELEVGRIF